MQWTLRSICERAWDVLRAEGLTSLWFKMLGETLYRRLILFQLSLSHYEAVLPPGLPVTLGLLSEDDVDEFADYRPDRDAQEVRQRLESGQWCFLARHEGSIVHAGWAVAHRARVEYLSCTIDLSPNEIYVYESHTVSEYRGRGLAPAQRSFAAHFFRDLGYRRMLAAVMPENRPAFRPMEKARKKKTGKSPPKMSTGGFR